MSWKKGKIIVVILFVTVGFLSACRSTTIKIGWVCVNDKNELDCRYNEFSGKEIKSIKVNEGETLEFSFDIEVQEGELAIKILDPSENTVWEKEFIQSVSEGDAITATESGRYRLVVEGLETAGAFIITWQVID